MSQTAKSNRVYFALFEGVQLLDVSGPAEVLTEANRASGRLLYDIHYVSHSREGKVVSSAGLGLVTERLPRKLEDFRMIVVPGARDTAIAAAMDDSGFMKWLGRATQKADRVASVCSGAFLLGELGLLDGRRVTTHWSALTLLQKRFPTAKVASDMLYVQDGNLWTSAGVLSGVDMALAMVTHDVSATVALKIARNLVVYLFREGGQSQFSAPIDLQTRANRSELLSLVAWLEDRLTIHTTVEHMADYMATSVRTLHRHCQHVFDLTPAQLLSELRLERSRELLQRPSIAIKAVATDCGFSNASSYSKAFSRRFGVTPIRYRDGFRDAR